MTTVSGVVVEKITREDIERTFPKRKNAVTDEMIEMFNDSLVQPEFQGETLMQVVSNYESLIMGRKGLTLGDLVNASRFVAYLISFDDNATEAYKKTFSHREFVKARKDLETTSVQYRELTNAASKYRRSTLVRDLLTHSQMPLDLMFTGARYKAIGVLAKEMEEAKFAKDRIMAAKELLAATKGPENLKIALDVGVQESSAVQQLNDQLASIAARQKMLIESGASTLTEIGSLRVSDDGPVEDAEYEVVE